MTTLALAAPDTTPPRPRLLAEAWVAAGTAVLLSAAVQGTLLVSPLLTMHVFDGVLESRNLSTLWVLSLAFTVSLLLGGLLRHLRAALLTGLAERLGRRLQLQALTASVRLATGGERLLPMQALQDVAELRRLLGGSLLANLLDLLAIPLALGFLFLLHPYFFAVALVAAIFKAVLTALADRATRGLVREATVASNRSSAELTGWLQQQDTVMGLGLLPAVLRRWQPTWLAAMEQQDAAQRRVKALQALLQLATFAQQIAVVTMGAWLLVRREASPGAMMAATTMLAFATNPIATLAAQWRDWSHGIAAWGRLRNLARDGAPPLPQAPDATVADGLVFDGVTLTPPGADKVLVRDLSLRLPPGEAWLLVGPNGAGKTTLLRATLGLAAPQQGRILLDGQDSFRADRSALGARIGYLPQEAQLLEGSVISNIARFTGDHAATAVSAARRAGAHGPIGRLPRGYDSEAGPMAGLSGGQRRLVAMARALHGSPRLLVLDEPEAGLDAAARAALREAVMAAKQDGSVVLLVTHDATPWAEVVDGVLRLDGKGGWTAEPATAGEDAR